MNIGFFATSTKMPHLLGMLTVINSFMVAFIWGYF